MSLKINGLSRESSLRRLKMNKKFTDEEVVEAARRGSRRGGTLLHSKELQHLPVYSFRSRI